MSLCLKPCPRINKNTGIAVVLGHLQTAPVLKIHHHELVLPLTWFQLTEAVSSGCRE